METLKFVLTLVVLPLLVHGVSTLPLKVDNHENRVSERQKRSTAPIAFHATINQNEVAHLGINQVIQFEKIQLNLGDGFHVTDGIFLATVPGLYMFSASVASGSENDVHASIVKNDVELANILGHGDSSQSKIRSNQGSVTVTVQLAAYDHVWVKIIWPSDASIRGDGFTSFTGVLIS